MLEEQEAWVWIEWVRLVIGLVKGKAAQSGVSGKGRIQG